MDQSHLGPQARALGITALSRENWDVVIIGGGVTGTGAALDAAARGLKVALVERADLASGTSSRSSKLLHGGLRYLEHLQFALVHEALRERGLLLSRIAPHLARATQFYLPLTRWWERPYIGAGVLLYDVLSGVRSRVPRHRHLTRRQLQRHAPDLAPRGVRGAIRYSDVQVDDSRLVVDLARTAAGLGATILPRCEVLGFDSTHGRVTGLRVRDLETGQEHEVAARSVINAAGPSVPLIEELAGVPHPVSVAASKGVHLLLDRAAIHSDAAWTCRTDRSVLFVLPWGDHWLVGTTDTPYRGDLQTPRATAEDVLYLVDQVNRVSARSIALDDVVATFVGLRPLVTPTNVNPDTAVISREHVVHSGMPGLFSIVGGKLTTYRVMARDVVDGVVGYLGVRARSTTHRLPLLGATRSRSSELAELIEKDARLGEDLPGVPGVTVAEVHHAVLREGALQVEDVLARRLHLAFERRDRGQAAADAVAAEMGGLLGWDIHRVRSEAERYRDDVARTLESLKIPEDSPDRVSRGTNV